MTRAARAGTILRVIPLTHPTVQKLLAVMDQKHHWAYPALTRPGLSRKQLLVHFQHEYATYVRDFPVLLARALGQVPPLPDVRRSLAENLYEEQTGGLSKTAPHPELFLRMMEGLGFARADFEPGACTLHPNAVSYRDWLVARSAAPPWLAGVALLTIFVEGSIHERSELSGAYERPRGDAAVDRHALVVHYGCPPSAMDLVRAHGLVEGGHREDAWRIVLDHAREESAAKAAIDLCMDALVRWHRYRDGVAELMGIRPDRTPSAHPDAHS